MPDEHDKDIVRSPQPALLEAQPYQLRDHSDVRQNAAPPKQDWHRRNWETQRDLREATREMRAGSSTKPTSRWKTAARGAHPSIKQS
ncbi:hypothetical protein EVAR_80830_1 [Eumeta japonica]|uniref:Uncharacterized protein n=1 Tax=Eumeta variegata TaxID=151549 RepID=A0A4C1WF84_EUMVA|nr:hypothetical protein EVAR_80830_1 [Eumeta japonica]